MRRQAAFQEGAIGIDRYKNYKLEGENVTLKLRKWSLMKFLNLNTTIGDVLMQFGDDFKFKDLTSTKIGQIVCTMSDVVQRRLVNLVCESIESPADITEEKILEWDLEDFIGVLAAVIEQNLTDNLQKKGVILLNSFQKVIPTVAVTQTQPTATEKPN